MEDVARAGAAAIFNEMPALLALPAIDRFMRLVQIVEAVLEARAQFAPGLEPSVN